MATGQEDATTISSATTAGDTRTLTSRDGRLLRAKILLVEGNEVVVLRLDDGRQFRLPIDQFSDEDIVFLRQWQPPPYTHEVVVSKHGISNEHGLKEYQAKVKTFDDGKYYIYVPKSYRSDESMPLVVSSHGNGFNGSSEIRTWQSLADEFGFIVLCPSYDGATNSGIQPRIENTMALIEEIMPKVLESFNIDRNHVMHTGFSGGGHPTWYAMNYPEWFTALCFRSSNFGRTNVQRVVPAPQLRKWRDRPVFFFWGTEDTPTVVGSAPDAIDFLKDLQVNLKKLPIEGGGHNPHPRKAAEWFVEVVMKRQ